MNIENINFRASQYAPNHLEVTYWVDLTEDPTGGVIKTYDGKKWNQIKGEAQSVDAYTKSQADSKFATKDSLSAKADKTALDSYALKTDLNTKANASDVYVKAEVYTKSQCEAKITEMIQAAMAPAA